MGPFGIAAVGLLANKGSGSKRKQGSSKDSRGTSRHSNEEAQVGRQSCADRLPYQSSDFTENNQVAGSLLQENAGHVLLKNGNKHFRSDLVGSSSKCPLLPIGEQDETSEALSGTGTKHVVSLSKQASLESSGEHLIPGLNHIRTRGRSVSVRTVESARDISEFSSDSMNDFRGRVSNDLRVQTKNTQTRVESNPIKLRRSGRIRSNVADSLNLGVESLRLAEAEKSSPTSRSEDTSEYFSNAQLVGDADSAGHKLNSQEDMSSNTNEKNRSKRGHSASCSPSDIKSDNRIPRGLHSDVSGGENACFAISTETMEMYDKKETESPRYKALLRLTCGSPNKKSSGDITSFSHELSSNANMSHPYWRFQNARSTEEVVDGLNERFHSEKEQVDSELALFAADLLDIMELEEEKQDKERLSKHEDLLVLARECSLMSVEEFRERCEGIVQKLEEERQILPLGRLKQLHIRLLFILTRCTRLLQYQKETGTPKEIFNSGLLTNAYLPSTKVYGRKKFYSQEQRAGDWKNQNSTALQSELLHRKLKQDAKKKKLSKKTDLKISSIPFPPATIVKSEKQELSEAIQYVICRICEEKVPTLSLEEHSHICALAVQCDVKGVSVDDRLYKLALVLDKLIETQLPGSASLMQGNSPDKFKTCAFNQTLSRDDLNRFSEDERIDEELSDDQGLATEILSFKSPCGSKSGCSQAPSSVDSITPRSPILSGSYFDFNVDDRVSLRESEDPLQVRALAYIARCIATANATEARVFEDLASCSRALENLLHQSKDTALTIHTFGARIQKLLRARFMELHEVLSARRASNDIGEDICTKENLLHSPRQTSYKDRTSIDDFEIIKPISRGAYGRVFLARKRTTGDLFAIKVLRKADMIRKNAVESILAERDILISTCNPFVVRLFYSFTCSENLYLVMEYLIGGDLYSLLRNVGCLDEGVSQIYIAELVLALEYLHSLGVVHRDLKPDNLLIAHDGHLKLTDFGLSKVGLINSTDDLSQPCPSERFLSPADHGMSQLSSRQSQLRKERQKNSAVGTPDYLAPEILLGTGHGPSADWWSTGIILFECLTGVPPFNAEYPEKIFENILNRKIPWPRVPEEMSPDAKDLIDKLLTEDPSSRLGANGAAEVKRHPFFKNIHWETLARQKAAFIPNPESPHDTSYFTSRHHWSGLDSSSSSSKTCQPGPLSDDDDKREKVDEQFDEPGDLMDFTCSSPSRFSFSNFSFKNLSQLASINYDLLMQSSNSDQKTCTK
ncbi:hypothetical protein KP509_39G018200 [Ceratopteris richardii]|uniref:non-specific serine/threonine protein kinase n=1 Tax=Ceratopteris richardii TaxID=49495 RepID=A0A8T2PZ27_CERRI|nr:hypothetical protein KP509_39G018200 [Ceratopteris richardii]